MESVRILKHDNNLVYGLKYSIRKYSMNSDFQQWCYLIHLAMYCHVSCTSTDKYKFLTTLPVSGVDMQLGTTENSRIVVLHREGPTSPLI